MTDSTPTAANSWSSPFENFATPNAAPTLNRPDTAPAMDEPEADPTDLDLSVLSVPQLPLFPANRHGIQLADVQDWYKNLVVPRFLETINIVKQQQRQVMAAEREKYQMQTASARSEGELQALRHQVSELTAQLQAASTTSDSTHRVLERAQMLADQLIADAQAESAVLREQAQTAADQQRRQAEAEAEALVGEARQLYANHQAIVETIHRSSRTTAQTLRTLADQLETSAQALLAEDPLGSA